MVPESTPQISILFFGEPEVGAGALLREMDNQQADIQVESVPSLESATEYINDGAIDCFVYDALMIEEGSTERFEEILKSRQTRPHVVLAGDAPDPFIERALQQGASEVIPLDPLDNPQQLVLDRIEFHVGKHRQDRGEQALWEKVRQVINQAEDIVWLFSPDWEELLFVNTAYERIWGHRLDELYARPQSFLEGVHPKDRPKVRRAMERLSAGEEIELEYRVNRAEDYGRWVWVFGYPITDDSGEMTAVSGLARDITDRKQQEQRQRRQRDRFLQLFEHFPEPTFAYRFEEERSVVVDVNAEFERVFGYDSEEAIGTDIDELLAPDELREEAAQLDERVRAGDFVDTEVRRQTADGDQYFRFRNIELPEDDEFDGFAIYADIHDQKEREQTINALHETSRELASAVDQQAIAEITADAVDEIIGIPWAGIWFRDDARDSFYPVHLTAGLESAVGQEVSLNNTDPLIETIESENEVHLDDTTSADSWPDSFSEIRSALVLGLGEHGFFLIGSPDPADIDDEHRSYGRILAANTEAAIERADREIALREQRRELQRQNERLEEFTSVVSHDLRTPLAVATAAVEQLSHEHGDIDVDQIENALKRMDNIISKTLTLAKSGQVTGDTQQVDLHSLATRCRHTVSATEMDLEVDDELPTIEADPDRLQHVFENLYRNAVEHGGPEVKITVEQTEDGFAVSDDGPGIPEDEIDKIFETGYSTTTDGTGFGLAIVKRIAESHGWSVHVEESAMGGARVRFSGVY